MRRPWIRGAFAAATAVAALAAAACASGGANEGSGGTDAASAAPAPEGPGAYDALLHRYVKGDYVDYAGWKSNPADLARLDGFLAWQAGADAASMSDADAIAFYINAYNSLCIKQILDAYPVHSPLDVDGFFDKRKFRVAGEELTVSEVEYDRLIARYRDMRAHFAVVCADRGCLPLRGAAWTGATLDADLDAAARRFVSDDRQFKVDPAKQKVEISKIFQWYGEKFTKDPVRPAAKPELYLLPWLGGDAKSLLAAGTYDLSIIEWNWTLNEKR